MSLHAAKSEAGLTEVRCSAVKTMERMEVAEECRPLPGHSSLSQLGQLVRY